MVTVAAVNRPVECALTIIMKLLVIEDEKDLSESICTYLGKEQFICETAYDYRAAVEKIHKDEYACIILDIMLPYGSGMDLLKP